MDAIADNLADFNKRREEQDKIAQQANEELEKIPWWNNFEQILDEIFNNHFKYHPHKTSYYPEVDSWSVMLPELQNSIRI